MKEILVKLAVNAVLLYGLALICGRRIRFGGLLPVVSVALFLVPINVFIRDIDGLLGIPDRPLFVFISAVVCNGAMLYVLSYIIPRFSVESLRIALAFAALMGAASLFINFFLAEQLNVWL